MGSPPGLVYFWLCVYQKGSVYIRACSWVCKILTTTNIECFFSSNSKVAVEKKTCKFGGHKREKSSMVIDIGKPTLNSS